MNYKHNNTEFENHFSVVEEPITVEEWKEKLDRRLDALWIDDDNVLRNHYAVRKYYYDGKFELGRMYVARHDESIYLRDNDIENDFYLIRKTYLDEEDDTIHMRSQSGDNRVYMSPLYPDEIEKIGKQWFLQTLLKPCLEYYMEENNITIPEDKKINYGDMIDDIILSMRNYLEELYELDEHTESYFEDHLDEYIEKKGE